MEQAKDFTVGDLGVKCQSKTEFSNLLAREGGIYLPFKQDTTQKFLRQILTGKKNYIKWAEINVIKVPQYKGIKVADIISFAQSHVDIKLFLPDYDYV